MGVKTALAVAAAIAASSASTPASAQFELLRFAICKKIVADADRLKCYDDIGKPSTEQNSVEPDAKPKAQWTITDSKSPIDDSPQVSALLFGDPEGAGLIIRCKERKTEAFFVTPSIFFTGTGNTATVLVRINDSPPVTAPWSPSTDAKALFAPNAIEFIKLLPDNGKLFLRATGFQGRTQDGTFDLLNVSSARERVAETCKWGKPAAAAKKTN